MHGGQFIQEGQRMLMGDTAGAGGGIGMGEL